VPPHQQQGQHAYAPQPGQPGAQGGAPAAAPPAAGGAPSIEARLERLAELKGKGLISDEEFQSRRAKILEEI
jgi:hypothetical protein